MATNMARRKLADLVAEKCRTCQFWRKVGNDTVPGECRYHAPVVYVIAGNVHNFPITGPDDQCRQWKQSGRPPELDLTTLVDSIGLPKTTVHALWKINGIKTLGQLLKLSSVEVLQLGCIGPESLLAITETLREYGLELRSMEQPPCPT